MRKEGRIVWKDKAGNLTTLARIPGIDVPKFIVLRPGMSDPKRRELVSEFLATYRPDSVAVRSSVSQEDSTLASFAGVYLTKLHIPPKVDDILQAVNEVLASEATKDEVVSHYAAARGITFSPGQMSVIVQEMIEAEMSGVIFSHDPKQPDGYYLISVSEGTGEVIVSGASTGMLVRVVRGIKPRDIPVRWLRELIKAMDIIERYYRSTSLDVEFAFRGDKLYILQCRPITTVEVVSKRKSEKDLLARIQSLNKSLVSRFRGDILGDMIDINPAELLGPSPTPLDISIFRYLFADRIVEKVRAEMGYDPLHVGLLQVVEGKPYVSLRAAAFSFRPRGIPDQIYERMFKVYYNLLVQNPALQNQVEFEVFAMTCGEKLEQIMAKAGLNEDEKVIVREAFSRLDAVFLQVSELVLETFDKWVREYEERTELLREASLDEILNHVAIGTEMFVRVARLAFYWKNKFEEKYPTANLNDLLVGHIHTINEQMQIDLFRYRQGMLSKEELVRQYGHLRIGQFSVFSESYEDDPDYYLFRQLEQIAPSKIVVRSHPSKETVEFKYVVAFMQARERVKFLFSKPLHIFATKLKKLLAARGISQHTAAQISWEQLRRRLEGRSTKIKTKEKNVLPLLLPEVIVPGVTDLRIITFSEAMPTYITNTIVKARVCLLEQLNVKEDVRGAIVVLPNADPGYDFLFHSGAVGIITKVGGPASHMAIRAIELQMPACIGCGERVYQKLKTANFAILDCATKQIIPF